MTLNPRTATAAELIEHATQAKPETGTMTAEKNDVISCRGCGGLVRINYKPGQEGDFQLTCPVCQTVSLLRVKTTEVENLGDPANFTVKPYAEVPT